jgi:tripartite-type tricarboxylate transporter receptor subunit TctC
MKVVRDPSVLRTLGTAVLAGVALTAHGAAAAAAAGGYPTKLIRLIDGFPPGGGSDLVTRTLAEKLSERLGQPVVVENRAGAGGSIGAEVVAKSPPDGYTVLLCTASSMGVNPALRKLPYDPVRDLMPVSLVSRVSYLLVVHPSLPAKTVKDLIRLAKERPGMITYASSGTGSASHLAMELFKNMAGVNLTHVSYKGSAQAVVDLVGGHVQAGFNNMVTSMPQVKSGKLRALGVSGPARSSAMPDVPTIAEAGLPGYEALQWYGVLLPARTPKPVLDRLHQDIIAILQMPDVRVRLTREGGDVVGSTPDEFGAYIKSEVAKWTKVVKAAGIHAD